MGTMCVCGAWPETRRMILDGLAVGRADSLGLAARKLRFRRH